MPYSIKKDIKPNLDDHILRKGQDMTVKFDNKGLDKSSHHRLFFTCEDRMHYTFKTEMYGSKLYMMIEDSLNADMAQCDRYCLDMSDDIPREFPKRACTKWMWPPMIGEWDILGYTENWDLGIWAKAENLVFEKGGYLRLRYERWDLKDGVHPRITAAEPDETIVIDIPGGTYDYQELSKQIKIPNEKTACVILTVEGKGYKGNVYFERPYLVATSGDNIIPAFDVLLTSAKEEFRSHGWMGMNLSKKEWPRFRVILNGETIFEGERYLRVHRYSPVEIDIPDGAIKDENTLIVEYISDYHDTVPVAFREMKILEKKKAPFHVHFVPDVAVQGKDIPLLVETEEDGIEFTVKSDVLSIKDGGKCDEKGLHVVTLCGSEYTNDMEFTLLAKDTEVKSVIKQAVIRPDDNVVCGSGDMIYVDISDIREVKEYIEWVFANKAHNFITIRPCYRWAGQRTVNPDVWKVFCKVCNEMGIDYVNIYDGRDLPGHSANPSTKMLKGERYLGDQQHERDGQLFYWNTLTTEVDPVMEVFYDMAQRLYREAPEFTEKKGFQPGIVQYRNNKMCHIRDIDCVPDMKEAHTSAIKLIEKTRNGVPRHTGPSIFFKYFYEAGYDWTGAETMDSATETLLSFMRGATKAYGKVRTGVHQAVQWSTYPHDTEERYRRFLLANYVAYMQGVTDLNTEEGLWFMESDYSFHNRFSEACKKHVEQQQKMLKFITTHSRSGRYYTPTAFIHGRYDGWNGFGGTHLFGLPQIQAGEPEDSWELLKIFYPLCRVSKESCHTIGNFPENSGKPFGLFSGNPNGNVDVVPVEKSDFSEYKLVCFAGYNAAEKEDMDRLQKYVENGGTLVATWAHFSTVTYRPDIDANKFDVISHPFVGDFSNGDAQFENGICVNLADNAKVLRTDEKGQTLVAEIPVGKGRVVLVNRQLYPGNPEIMPVYKALVEELNSQVVAEDFANIICGEDVEFTRYIQDDGSMHIYITPVDWYHDPAPKRNAKLRVGDDLYELSLDFGVITKIVVKDNVAAWAENPDFDVLSVEPVKVQGYGKSVVNIAKDGKVERKEINLEKEPIAVL